MATDQQVLQIVFEGIDNASNASKSVLKGVEDVANAGKNLTQPLADATAGVLKFQSGLLLAGAALATVAANEAQKFETAFREIATLIEQPVDNLDEFRRSILEYGQSSTQTLDNINRAVYDAISAGVDYKNALDAVRQSEILAVAGKTELGDANRILLQIVSAYADSNLTAADAADKLFTIVRTGVTTLPELSQSVGGVVAIAAQAGISFDELGAAVATLTKTQGTAEAITALKGVITGLISPSAEAKKATEELGLDFSASGIKANTFAGTLQQVIDKTDGNIDVISTLFGNVRGLSGVLGLATADGAAFAANLDAQKNSAGAAGDAFAKFNGILDTGVDAVKILAIQLGEPVMQAFINAKGEITNITNALANALLPGGPLSGLGDTLGKFGEDIEATLKNVAKNLPAALENVDFSGFLAALESLWSAIGQLLRIEDLQTEEGLTKVIQTVVDLLTQTTTFTEKALKALEPFVKQVGEFVVALSKIDPAQIALIGELGGYALAANIGFTALAAGAGTLYAALKVVPPLVLALKVEIMALGAFAAGASGAALLAFMGKAGIAGAAAALAYELGRDDGAIDQLKDFAGLDRETNLAAGAITEGTNKIFGALLKLTGHLDQDGKPAMDRYADSAGGVGDALNDAGGDAAGAAVELGKLENIKLPKFEYADELGGLATDAETAGQALSKLPADVQKTNLAVIEAGKSTDEYAASLGGISTEYKQIGDATVKATGHFAEVGDKTKDAKDALNELVSSGKLTADQLLQMTKNAQDFETKMEEIASNERIKTIEAMVTLNVAQLEADAKRVEAIFASIDTTINSTGELLGTLFGLLGDADTYDKLKIAEQIALENQRRQEALDLQKKLVEAEIARIEAQTRRIDRADPFIQITADGLEPELEAFMWKILQKTRMRVNAEYGDFLLGLEPA